jgi:hypothetical protein
MKIAIAFCVLALAAAANDAVEDGSHMKDVAADSHAVCGLADSPLTEVEHYKFDSASNWVGDNGAKASRTAFVTTRAGGITMRGHHEKTITWTTRAVGTRYTPHSRCQTSCDYFFGSQCQRTDEWCYNYKHCAKRNRWGWCTRRETRRHCTGQYYHTRYWCGRATVYAPHATEAAAGYCNIAAYNGENMWVVAGSAYNNLKAAHYSNVDSGDDNHYCELSTVETFQRSADTECQLSYFIDTWGSLESNDITCVEAVKTNGDVITRKCMTGQEMGSDATHTVTSEWFSGADEFKIALNAITQGTYLNGHEIIAHDDVKLTCRPCATDAPTKAPTNAPTKAPTDAPTKAPTATPTAACQTTCALGSSGLIEVDHDASSGHKTHRCYLDEMDVCQCECSNHSPARQTI